MGTGHGARRRNAQNAARPARPVAKIWRWLQPAPSVPCMRQTPPRDHTAARTRPKPRPSSSWRAILVALATAGAAIVAVSSSSAAPARAIRSEAATRAEDDTSALLDERMALHLRRLR